MSKQSSDSPQAPSDAPVVAIDPSRSNAPELPERWKEFLRIRDEVRGESSALVLCRNAGELCVLLAREGIRVTALDSALDEIADEESSRESDPAIEQTGSVVNVLDTDELELALESGSFGLVILMDGYRFPMDDVLAALRSASATSAADILVDVPFGVQVKNDAGFVTPGLLVESLPGYSMKCLEPVDHRLHARFAPGSAETRAVPVDELLRITELAARERIEHLEARVASLNADLNEARSNWSDAEFRIKEMEESTALRTAFAVSAALRSPRAMFKLPGEVAKIVADRGRRGHKDSRDGAPAQTGLSEWDKEAIRAAARKSAGDGADAVVRCVDRLLPNEAENVRSFAYLIAAQASGTAGHHDVEFAVARHALGINESIGMLRGFLHVSLRCREMEAASEALRRLHEAEAEGNRIARDFLKGFRQTSSYKISVLEAIPPRPEQWTDPGGRRIAYILHNSLPYSSGGYATRSHGVATGLVERGQDVVCLTRPGYPLDIRQDLAPIDVPLVDSIDDVVYQRVSEPSRRDVSEYQYVLAAADRMEAELRRLAPAYVQAASNYVTGLPALIAARRLGIPFIYEVRGLWEITRMSRDQQFAESISFDVQRHIEGTLAREADHVFTLTEPMREELIERGVTPERITLLPNSVDAGRFRPSERDASLAAELDIPAGLPVIGYVGTFVIYEGLEHLVEACVSLHRSGVDFRLLLVGNENASGQELGPITEEILRIAREGGIESKLILTGRVPHERVEAYYSLIDICPFPRKPWPVCEMVSPMKPLEALALKKAVVVSSVRALTEMIQDEVTGLVFEKGDVESLANVLRRLIDDVQLRERLGESGREWVVESRAWSHVAAQIESVLEQFDRDRVTDVDQVPEQTAQG